MKKRFAIIILLFVLLSAWGKPVEAGPVSKSELDADALDAYMFGQISKHETQA